MRIRTFIKTNAYIICLLIHLEDSFQDTRATLSFFKFVIADPKLCSHYQLPWPVTLITEKRISITANEQ